MTIRLPLPGGLPPDAVQALARRPRGVPATGAFVLPGLVPPDAARTRHLAELERGVWNALQRAGQARRLEGPPVPPLPTTAPQATLCTACGQWVAGEFHGCRRTP